MNCVYPLVLFLAKKLLKFGIEYVILKKEIELIEKGWRYMTELKKIVAHNIATLRIKAHLTQFELGEKLNYSDKAVSRWERGEAIPDAYVLLMMSEIFGVTVDYLLKEHSEEELLEETEAEVLSEPEEEKTRRFSPNHKRITWITFLSIWAISLLVFVITATAGAAFWLIFIYALPVSGIVLLVLNSVWGTRRHVLILVSVLVWSILLSLHLTLLPLGNFWMIYLLGIPAQVIIPIAFSIRKKQ